MWYGNPFSEKGWCGKDANWFTSGWGNYTYWATEKRNNAYRWIYSVHNFVEHEKFHFFAQKAMFHGSIPNPGFPPLSFYFSS